MEMFRFQSPYWFWLLLFLPVFYFMRRSRKALPIGVPNLKPAGSIREGFFVRTRWIGSVLKAVAFVLMVVALARPQWGNRETVRLTEGINIVLAVDVSESMSALDFKLAGESVDRLQAVKSVVRKFISKRGGDRIGLVVFGSEAYTQMPLTNDYNAILSVLDRVRIGSAGKATAIGDAIGISLKRLEDIPGKSSIVILLTDGRSNSGELSPQAAADAARELGVKVYTIGVGTRGPVPFVVNDPLWGKRVVHRKVDIDEDTLKSIASDTGGLYFHADQSKKLEEIYSAIDRMEKTRVEVKHYDNYHELYDRFLIPAFLLLLMSSILVNTRYLEIP